MTTKMKRKVNIVVAIYTMSLILLMSCATKSDVSNALIQKIENNSFNDICLSNLKKQIDKSKLVNLHKWDESIENCDSIVFGKYEIDGNLSNGLEDIEWVLVDLNEEKNEAVLLSKYVLDCKTYADSVYILKDKYPELNDVYTINEFATWTEKVPKEEQLEYVKSVYGEQFENGNWKTSTLREWLNKEFYETAFSKDERAIIKEKTYSSNIVVGEEIADIVETSDKVFCIDMDELVRYLNYDSETDKRFAMDKLYHTSATQFAKKVKNFGDGINAGKQTGASCNYWLRTIVRPCYACTISSKEAISFFGYRPNKYWNNAYVEDRDIGVRPAILVDLNIDNIKESFNSIVDDTDRVIKFNEKMFEGSVENNEDLLEDVDYYFSGGRW